MDINVKDIIEGHYNQITKQNRDISEVRLEICNECPLCNKSFGTLWICNPRLWINPETGDVSDKYKHGYKKGCGCNLKAKTTLDRSVCPSGKW